MICNLLNGFSWSGSAEPYSLGSGKAAVTITTGAVGVAAGIVRTIDGANACAIGGTKGDAGKSRAL